MFKNISLRIKIWIVVGTVIVISGVITSNSILNTNSITNGFKVSVYDESNKSVNLILNADRDYYQALTALQKLLYENISVEEKNNQIQDYKDNMQQVSERISQANQVLLKDKEKWNKYAGLSSGKDIFEYFSDFEVSYNKFKNTADLMTASRSEITGWEDQFNSSRESLNAIGEMVDTGTINIINDLMKQKKSYMETIIVINIIGIILSIALSIFVIKGVDRMLKKLSDATRNIANGDLMVNIDVDSTDEIGQLAHNFNDMVKQQREVVLSVAKASNVLNGASKEIGVSTKELTTTAKSQAQTVEEFRAALEEMDTGIQDVTGNISKLASNVSGVSTTVAEMGKSIQETANNVEDAASAINQVSASIEQMGESIKGIAEQSKQAQQEAGTTVAKAEEGNMAVGNTIQEMDGISQAVAKLSTAIKELGNSAEKIGEIVDVIDDIAEQTNLLSLNASIEAARAGEAGKGFAVVANSIRGLAEKSGEATKDISRLIKGIQYEVKNAVDITKDSTERVKDGVKYVKGTGDVFEQIFEAITKTSDFIDEISAMIEQQDQGSKEIVKATEKIASVVNQLSSTVTEQAAGSDDIVKSVTNINDLTQQISATTQQQAASSQEIVKLIQGINKGTSKVTEESDEIASTTGSLASQAQELYNLVGTFKVE